MYRAGLKESPSWYIVRSEMRLSAIFTTKYRRVLKCIFSVKYHSLSSYRFGVVQAILVSVL